MKKLNPILKILFIALGLLAVFILFLCANFIFKKFIEYNITREFLKELYGSIMYFIKHGGWLFIATSLLWLFGNKIYNKLFWKTRLFPRFKNLVKMRNDEITGLRKDLRKKDIYIEDIFQLLNKAQSSIRISSDVLREIDIVKEGKKRL
jgi:thiosulfate reductase cytochrome b subunit